MAPYSMPFRTQLYINSSFTLNLKAAVTKHTRDELVLNSAYSDLEDFYGSIVLPPPLRKPRGYRQKSVIGNSSLIHPIVSAVYRFFTDNNFFQHAQLISYF